jgi:hypothetical protein
VRFNKGTIRMLFVTEPNRLKVLAGKILALTTSIAAAIAIQKRLINHAPAEEHLFGAPVEDRLWDGCQPSLSDPWSLGAWRLSWVFRRRVRDGLGLRSR